MNKYIDVDKLKVEIERRRLSNRYIDTEGYENELFEIIDSLQQEQPKSICPRCVHRNKTDDSCEYPYGGRNCLINKNGVYECNGFEGVGQQEQPLTVESVVEQCKKFGGNPEVIQQVVDFDNEYKSYIESRKDDLSGNAVTVNMKDLARHFYQFGQSVMRKRITNPEYNHMIIEKMKFEYPTDKSDARKEE